MQQQRLCPGQRPAWPDALPGSAAGPAPQSAPRSGALPIPGPREPCGNGPAPPAVVGAGRAVASAAASAAGGDCSGPLAGAASLQKCPTRMRRRRRRRRRRRQRRRLGGGGVGFVAFMIISVCVRLGGLGILASEPRGGRRQAAGCAAAAPAGHKYTNKCIHKLFVHTQISQGMPKPHRLRGDSSSFLLGCLLGKRSSAPPGRGRARLGGSEMRRDIPKPGLPALKSAMPPPRRGLQRPSAVRPDPSKQRQPPPQPRGPTPRRPQPPGPRRSWRARRARVQAGIGRCDGPGRRGRRCGRRGRVWRGGGGREQAVRSLVPGGWYSRVRLGRGVLPATVALAGRVVAAVDPVQVLPESVEAVPRVARRRPGGAAR